MLRGSRRLRDTVKIVFYYGFVLDGMNPFFYVLKDYGARIIATAEGCVKL